MHRHTHRHIASRPMAEDIKNLARPHALRVSIGSHHAAQRHIHASYSSYSHDYMLCVYGLVCACVSPYHASTLHACMPYYLRMQIHAYVHSARACIPAGLPALGDSSGSDNKRSGLAEAACCSVDMCVYACRYVHTCVCMHTCMYTCVCVCITYVCMYTHTHAYVYLHAMAQPALETLRDSRRHVRIFMSWSTCC